MAKKAQEKKNSKKTVEENIKETVSEETTKEEIVVEKTKKEKKEKSDKKPANEKLAKQKKKTERKRNATNVLANLDNKLNLIVAFTLGVVLSIIVTVIIWPDRIATLEDGTQPVATIDGKIVTADELYEEMKEEYSISLLLNNIDNTILEKSYPEDDELKKAVNDDAEYYLNMYETSYGYTKEQFLEANGFKNYDDFIDYLTLDYRRSKYVEDYIEENLTDEEINNYYNKNVFGSINCQHILIQTNDKVNEETAKKKAQEIIDKLNKGTSWDDIKKEYKDSATIEDLGYQAWNANLETSFMDALKALKDDSYSKEPVKTSYGYHVIRRFDQKETPSLKEVKENIIKDLIEEKQSKDSNISTKALIALREKNNLTFSDTVMEEKYKKYSDQYK